MKYPPYGNFQSFRTNGNDVVPVIPPSMSMMFLNDEVRESDTITMTTGN